MGVKEEIQALREEWEVLGVPKDAAKRITAILAKHIGRDDEPDEKKPPTHNEGFWCDLCGIPLDGHNAVSPGCEGRFGVSGKPEPGSDG